MTESSCPSGPSSPNLATGFDLYFLWLSVNQWTKRRVETAEFLGPLSLKRRVSIDLVVPDLASTETVLVPLALLEKRPLLNLDVTDEAHASVPICTRQENGNAAWSMLTVAAMVEIAQSANATEWPELDGLLLQELREIVFTPLRRATEVIAGFKENRSSEPRRILAESAHFMGTADSLARHFLLLTPVDNQSGRRRILKFAYTESLERVGKNRGKFTETMGWSPARFEFAVPGVGEAESFHFELCAPQELEAADAQFLILDPVGTTRRGVGVTAGSVAHFYAAGDEPDCDGVAAVWLRLSPSGLPRSGFMLASFTLGILVLLGVLGVHTRESDGSSAILLTLPALVATAIIRPGEHGLVTDLLFGIRMTVATIGFIAYSAALLLAVGLPEPAQKAFWLVLQVGSLLCWTSLVLALFPRPTKGIRSMEREE